MNSDLVIPKDFIKNNIEFELASQLENGVIKSKGDFDFATASNAYMEAYSVSGLRLNEITKRDIQKLETFTSSAWIIPIFNLDFKVKDFERINITDWLPSFTSEEELILRNRGIKTYNGLSLVNPITLRQLRMLYFHYRFPFCLSYYGYKNPKQSKLTESEILGKTKSIANLCSSGELSISLGLKQLSTFLNEYQKGYDALNTWMLFHAYDNIV
ncbi:hypothetical protein [Companilactobacillus zhachilii]|uniref:hypothetical protein n=1 Tax=Companilactobacillus zhachilii TaxID=2304606 RepID=UPI004034C2E9